MSNNNDIRVVLGSLRYKSAPDVDFGFKLPLVQNVKMNVEFDRVVDINLQQLYDDERQASTLFRPTVKYQLLFKNSYAGETNYPPFENNLYYINALDAAGAQCANPANPQFVSWTGLPLYNEFDFIRNDYNVSGYTQGPNEHLTFIPKSANSYNWSFYFSYPYQNVFNKLLDVVDNVTQQTMSWLSGDGLPFVILMSEFNGQNYVSFRCPMKHGLSVGEYVKLSFDYNGQSIFQVDSLGNGFFGTEEYVFNVSDIGFTGLTFQTGIQGTFKRVILNSNSADTMSIYYIRKNRILTSTDEAVIVKTGFEENIFGIQKKLEKSAATPNYLTRVSIKEGCQSYTFSLNKDIDLNGLIDNLGRPVTELFATTIWKGFFGWTLGGPPLPGSPPLRLKQGHEFNLPLNSATNQPSVWWDDLNSNSDSSIPTSQWNNPSGNTFYYVESLNKGDLFDGDLCEWNNFEQLERVISKSVHKIKFNPTYFDIKTTIPTNQLGYYYYPNEGIRLKDYSDYIEFGDPATIDNLPNYAYYSTTLGQFIWRDLFTYGFLDTGSPEDTSFPFLNNSHYPYKNCIFRIIPEGTNYVEDKLNIVKDPTTDECE